MCSLYKYIQQNGQTVLCCIMQKLIIRLCAYRTRGRLCSSHNIFLIQYIPVVAFSSVSRISFVTPCTDNSAFVCASCWQLMSTRSHALLSHFTFVRSERRHQKKLEAIRKKKEESSKQPSVVSEEIQCSPLSGFERCLISTR